MSFIQSSIDLFLQNKRSHMGQYQFAAHSGMRGHILTSGAKLWSEAEAIRYADSKNMVRAEVNLLHIVAKEIRDFVPQGTPVVELGPGTAIAFENKTYPIIQATNSQECTIVDDSSEFLKQIIEKSSKLSPLNIKPVRDNFFENSFPYLDKQALVCSFGSTISNIVHHVSKELPEESLASSLSKMASAANEGWFLIGFDSDNEGNRIKSYFNKHALFQLNIFDRMAVELPICGDFDPSSIRYEPVWIESSQQLAHMAVTSRQMKFSINNTNIILEKEQYLHIKNSYKFSTGLFEKCCKKAGLRVIRHWSSETFPVQIYLLRFLRNSYSNSFATIS